MISVHGLLEVLASFDEHGGSSPGLVAWELFADERDVMPSWEHALTEGWLTFAGRDPADDEQLWKLTLRGWEAVWERAPELKPVRQSAEEQQ
jgi:hypothetical protein